MKSIFFGLIFFALSAHAVPHNGLLIQTDSQTKSADILAQLPVGTTYKSLGINNWALVKPPKSAEKSITIGHLKSLTGILNAEPNRIINLMGQPSLKCDFPGMCTEEYTDNPAILAPTGSGSGGDPLLAKQWGMNDIGVQAAWSLLNNPIDIVVAVIDTGVDYNHPDLVNAMWRNPGETGNGRETNGIDDDGNGYIDDVVGWDFVTNDNKPYDMPGDIMNGGNPGHGTHCAGNVAASTDNGKGMAGVAPTAKIMALRFMGEAGQGDLAGAIGAIKYASDNGARVTSNSWGFIATVGEAENDEEGIALKDAIQYSLDRGTLFVAAAGNGDPQTGQGYDNDDTNGKPAYPATYTHDGIISVAAIDVENALGTFSNWGKSSVDIGAPGVKVLSTVVGGGYNDMVLPFMASWDGTSMATPHVAGAAALYWSNNPQKSPAEVKTAILNSAAPINGLMGRLVTDGKLDVEALMRQ